MLKLLTRLSLAMLLISLLISLSGCVFESPFGRKIVPSGTPVVKPTKIVINTWTPVYESTVTPPVFQAALATSAPIITPTPWLIKQGPGKVVCPILLYHRIAIPKGGDAAKPGGIMSPYYVTPVEFRAQIQALKEWGYVTIPVFELVDAIKHGTKLPARPIIISFDDGDASVYSQAFPVMREYGFTGINYLVKNYIGAEGYLSVAQIKELSAAGWEVGSHSMTHSDLTTSSHLEFEIIKSKDVLEKMLDVKVQSFAYPFGMINAELRETVAQHYLAAMGLGVYVTQRPVDIHYLWRRPVEMGWDVQTFGSFLPWNSPIYEVH